jgi:hypothetical protein
MVGEWQAPNSEIVFCLTYRLILEKFKSLPSPMVLEEKQRQKRKKQPSLNIMFKENN